MVRGKAAKKKSKPDDAFAQRAYRRPVTQAEIEPYVQLVLRQKVEPIVTLEGGIKNLKYRVYEGQWEKLPKFDELEPVAEGTLPKGFIDLGVPSEKRNTAWFLPDS